MSNIRVEGNRTKQVETLKCSGTIINDRVTNEDDIRMSAARIFTASFCLIKSISWTTKITVYKKLYVCANFNIWTRNWVFRQEKRLQAILDKKRNEDTGEELK